MSNGKAFWIALAFFFSFGQAPSQPPDTLWTRVIGGSQNDNATAIVPTSDGGVIVAGNSLSFSAAQSAYIVKLSSIGDTVWTRVYGETESMVWGMTSTHDGGCAFVGSPVREGCAFLTKLGPDGSRQWSEVYADSGEILFGGTSVAQSGDGGYIVGVVGYYPCIIRIDTTGREQWRRYARGAFDIAAMHAYVAELSDGDYALAATATWSGQPGSKFWLARYSVTGDSLWERFYGRDSASNPCNAGLVAADDGGCLFGGGYWDDGVTLVRVAADGDSLWTYAPSVWIEEATALVRVGTAGYLLGGNVAQNPPAGPYVAYLDDDGIERWIGHYSTPRNGNCSSLTTTSDSCAAFCGCVIVGSQCDYQVVKMARTLDVTVPSASPRPAHFTLLPNFPNPFNFTTHLEFTLPTTQQVALRLYDVLGREVAVLMNEIQTAGQHRLMFDASGLPSGVYLCQLEAGEMAQTRKIVLLK